MITIPIESIYVTIVSVALGVVLAYYVGKIKGYEKNWTGNREFEKILEEQLGNIGTQEGQEDQ